MYMLLKRLSWGLWQVCNHRFHNECLQRWGDTSCPVCRYCVNTSANTSHCTVCGTSQVGFQASPPVVSVLHGTAGRSQCQGGGERIKSKTSWRGCRTCGSV